MSSNASIYFTGNYFRNAARKVIYDGSSIYFSGKALDPDNLNVLKGKYGPQIICYTRGSYVFTDEAVYDRDTYLKITELPFHTACVLMDSQNYEYLFNRTNNTLVKTSLDLSFQPGISHTAVPGGIQFDKAITDWAYDESSGMIYAVSMDSNMLLYINADTLDITGQKFIGSAPSDIELYNNKIYIALSGASKAAITGTAVESAVETIELSAIPYQVAVDSDKLFYSGQFDSSNIYVYRFSDHSDTKISGTYYCPDITLDRAKNILYIGESGLSSGRLAAISTVDYSVISSNHSLSTSSYFSYPERTVISDGMNVYYSGCALDPDNLDILNGVYKNTFHSKIRYVRGNYIFTEANVYNRDTYQKITELPFNASLVLMDPFQKEYLFNLTNNTLIKTTLDLDHQSTVNYTPVGDGVELSEEITDWVYDSENNYIYVISSNSNMLVYIDAGTMEVVGQKFIGSMPADIKLLNHEIYVALNGATKVAITGTTVESPVNTIVLTGISTQIAIDSGKLFYTSAYPTADLYVYDLSTQTNTRIKNILGYIRITTDTINHVLYIGDINGSTSELTALNTADYTILSSSNSYNYPYGNILFDGTDVFFAGYRVKGTDMTLKLGFYQNSIENVYDHFVFARYAIYDRDTYTKLYDLPSKYYNYQVIVGNDGAVYYFIISSNPSYRIYKYDSVEPYAKTLSVTGSSSVSIPASGQAATSLSVLAKDQYGNIIFGTPAWSIKEPYDGVAIDSAGILTVETSALPGTVTVEARLGGVAAQRQVSLLGYQAAPTGLSAKAPTSPANNNGQIAGVTAGMEYKKSTASSYLPVAGTAITGLTPGTYFVRYAAKPGYSAGADALVTVPEYTDSGSVAALSRLADAAELYLASSHVYLNDANLRAADEEARAVLADENATQSEIDAAIAALSAEVNRAFLEDLITIAQAEHESDYPAARWIALQAELAEAESLLYSAASPAADIGSAADKLYFALNTLPAFDSMVEIVQAFTSDDCSEKTWTLLQQTLSEALTLQADPYWKIDEVTDCLGDLLTGTYSVFLDQGISVAEELMEPGEEAYSAETWRILNDAYAGAILVQAQPSSSLGTLISSYDSLQVGIFRASLENVISRADEIQPSNCSSDDWAGFQAALNAAADLLKNGGATSEELISAQQALLDGYGTIFAHAPSGLTGTAPTSPANLDGQITGTTGLMEYKLSSDTAWNKVTGSAVTGLAPGTYLVRYSSETGFAPGEAAAMTIPAFPQPDVPPAVSQLTVTGTVKVGETISGHYTFEGALDRSTCQWYSAADSSGTNATAIPGATGTDFQPTASEEAAYLCFEVTPCDGTNTGTAVRSSWSGPVAPSGAAAPITGGGIGGGAVSAGPSVSSSSTGTEGGSITTVSAAFSGTVSEKNVSVEIDGGTMGTLIKNAGKAEADGGRAVIRFDLTGSTNAANLSVTIPSESFTDLAGGTEASLQLRTGIGTVTFNAAAVDGIGSSAPGDVSLSISLTDPSALSDQVRQEVGDRPVYSFTVSSGEQLISTFGSGSASVSLPYSLKEGEDPGAVVVYYIDATGSLQTVRGAYNGSTGTVDFVTDHFSGYVIGYHKVAFPDVPEGKWYEPAVTFIAARGIALGNTAGQFLPDAPLTRADFVVMLLRAFGIEPIEHPEDNFDDAGDTYYTGYLAAAKKLGIINGVGGNAFRPGGSITRQDMFTMLYRTLTIFNAIPAAQSEKTLVDFSDGNAVADYARQAVEALVKSGVVSGDGASLNPAGSSSRAQMAQVLFNILDAQQN